MPQYTITMLPACEGDCFFLEFQSGDSTYNMMIDCGPKEAWPELEKHLDVELKNKDIDVLVLTHFDSDHIEGVLQLLKEEKYRNRIREVWHNGLEQIAPELPRDNEQRTRINHDAFRGINERYKQHRLQLPLKDGHISATDSICLSLQLKKHEIKVNPNSITNNTEVNEVGAEKDLIIDFLLPTQEKLDALIEKFGVALSKMSANPRLTDAAIEAFEYFLLEPDDEYEDGPIAGRRPKDVDPSPTNASSIVMIIRFHGQKLLFAGDAVDRDLNPALDQWQKDHPEENLFFDVVKLPHHGSARNCWKLLERTDFRSHIYLVSTDGSEPYSHPDVHTIDQIKRKHADIPCEVIFNYPQTLRRFTFPSASPNCKLSVQKIISKEVL